MKHPIKMDDLGVPPFYLHFNISNVQSNSENMCSKQGWSRERMSMFESLCLQNTYQIPDHIPALE